MSGGVENKTKGSNWTFSNSMIHDFGEKKGGKGKGERTWVLLLVVISTVR